MNMHSKIDVIQNEMWENKKNYVDGEYSLCLENLDQMYKLVFSFYKEELKSGNQRYIPRLQSVLKNIHNLEQSVQSQTQTQSDKPEGEDKYFITQQAFFISAMMPISSLPESEALNFRVSRSNSSESANCDLVKLRRNLCRSGLESKILSYNFLINFRSVMAVI